MGAFSIWHWLLIVIVVALIFGTSKLRNVGEDLGNAIKSFRKGMQDGDNGHAELKADPPPPPTSANADSTKSTRVE